MSINLPAACAQAAGIVAAGYLSRTAALVNDGDVQVSMRMRFKLFQISFMSPQPVQHAFQDIWFAGFLACWSVHSGSCRCVTVVSRVRPL